MLLTLQSTLLCQFPLVSMLKCLLFLNIGNVLVLYHRNWNCATKFLFVNVKELIELNDVFEDMEVEVIDLPISTGSLNEKNVSN